VRVSLRGPKSGVYNELPLDEVIIAASARNAAIPLWKRSNVKNASKRLKKLRKTIDLLDAQLVSLLNRRAGAALAVKNVKEAAGLPYFAPHREIEVYRRAAALNRGPFPPEALNAVLAEVISGCMALETRLKVAYMGPRATNTHLAAIRRFGSSSDLAARVRCGAHRELDRGRGHLHPRLSAHARRQDPL